MKHLLASMRHLLTETRQLLVIVRGMLIDLWNCIAHACWVLCHALLARNASLRDIVSGSVKSAAHLWRAYRELRRLDEGPFVPGPVLAWLVDVYNAVGFFFEVLLGGIRAGRVPLARIVRGATNAGCAIYRCYRLTRRPSQRLVT